tara:strand:+ start:1316 stop:1711 length:396 start_codon:yes stop_codon:yes gene_type:complete
MAMKNIMENFRNSLPEYDDKSLQEVETREGFRNYKITMFVKIDKKANLDVRQVFGKIRAIPGVTTLKQERAIGDRGTHWLCEVTIKFNTRGMPNKNYIYDILARQINSEIESKGIPGCKVYGINWQSFSEI